jgi:PAS domain S-box-containing protein
VKTETVTVKNTSSGFARGGIALPVYAVAALTVVFIWFGGLVDVSYENRSLTLLLNTLLVTGVSVLGAVLVFRGYIASGLPGLLYAGCGLVAMGSSFLFSSLIIDAAAGPNHEVTVNNLGVLCASFFHLAASLCAGQPRVHKPDPSVFKAAAVYLGVLALTGLFWAAAQYDLSPAFYIPGKGTTPVRQLVLMVSVALLSVAAAFLIRHAARRGSLSLRCYGLGLGLIAMGLVDVSIAVPGSILSWTGSLSQSLGNLYLLAAFMIVIRTAVQKGFDVREAAADYYLESEGHYRTLVSALRSAVISIDPHGKVILWNRQAEAIFGYTYAEAAGRPLADLVASDGDGRESFEDVLKNRPDRYVEMVLRRKSGVDFPADVFAFAVGGGWKNWTNLIVRDITERRQAQDLTQSAALFPEENPLPVMRAARAGELLYANRASANLISQWQCPVGAKVPGEVQRELIAALDSGKPREMAIRCSDRDLSLMLVPIAERNYVNFYGRDVTEYKRADQALRESEQIYHAIGESIDYGVWICAPDGRNIYASESFLKMVGITQQQCADFGWGNVLHPDDAERTIVAWKECVRTRGTWDIEHRFRGADGQWHNVLARGVPVKNEKGDVVCWAGINLDIGRLKRTEQELEAARAEAVKEKNLLEAVMEALPVGVSITDSRGGHLKINRAFEELWGGSPPAVRSFDDYAVYKAWWLETGAAVGPAEWSAACALRTGETFTGQSMQIERFDGTRAFVISSASPIFDSKGKIDGSAVVIMDITGLQEAQQALRNAHGRLVTILESISDGFFSLDRLWRVTFINEKGAQVLGQTREAMLGRVLWEIFPDAVGSDFERAYQRTMTERLTTTIESFYEPLNAWFEARAYPTEGGLSVFFRNVTDRRRVEQTLRESQTDLNWAQAVGQIGSWRLNVRRNELLWSDENHRIFGVPTGTPLTYETFLSIVHPEDREFVDRKWTAALRGEPYDIEHRIVVGQTVKWVRERAELEFDSGGQLLGGFGITQDITAKKISEQALRDSEEALRKANEELEGTVRRRTAEMEETVATLKNEIVVRRKVQTQLHQLSRVFMDAADPIIIEDLSGTVVEMNHEAEQAYGYSREALIGQPVTTLFIPERHDQDTKLRERCCAGEEVRNWESVRKARSGRIIPSFLTAFPLMDESGNIAFVATICKDISARKQMEAMLVESQRHLRELSRKSLEALEADRRTVARELHDSVGGSLAAIKFGLEEVAEQATQDPVCGAASLGTLISHLMDTIKETKRISANLRPLMLDDLGLLATIDWYTRQSRQRYGNIRLIQQIDVQEHEVPEEYKIVFYRVMQEAVNNAAKHSRADTIYIRLRKGAAHFELEVEDNGTGFDLSEIFNRQDRLSGFGLKSMQERAEMCGGILNVHTQPGEGTIVKVTLPVR